MAGSALCLHDDLANARALVGDVPVIAVNAAAREVKAIALMSLHPERFKSFRWIEYQFRFHDQFSVHGVKPRDGMPWVDHWWPDCAGGGSSAWCARKLAWLIGFDPVILCGCPLEPMPYVGYRPAQLMADMRMIEQYREQIRSQPEWREGAFSMSGWTREYLGTC